MSSASIHDKLTRVRRPRVHITYQVETEGARILKELPFVMGVLGDFSGNQPSEPLKALKDRKFVKIDRDNFNDVMAKFAPGLSFRVRNTLKDEKKDDGTYVPNEAAGELPVSLKFESMADFEPAKIVEQVKPLRNLLEARDKLRDLLTKVDRSDELESLLERVLKETQGMERLKTDLGEEGAAKTPEGGA